MSRLASSTGRRVLRKVEVARRSQARGLGIDAAAVARAAQSSPKDVDVTFLEGDLDELSLPASSYDGVMVIDALYFARDLRKTLDALLSALRPGRHLVTFHSTFRGPDQPASVLTRDGTALAKALRANDADYTCSSHVRRPRALAARRHGDGSATP